MESVLCAVTEFQEFLRVMKNQKIAESRGDGGEICKSVGVRLFWVEKNLTGEIC